MSPTFLQIILLGIIQGAAELLPVSSSAHVIVVEKVMGLDPAHPEMTFLLVMLHTGTMFAVIAYFWRAWRENFFGSAARLKETVRQVAVATLCTLALGGALKLLIEKVILGGGKAEFEQLFASLPLIAGALAAAGVLILIAAARAPRDTGRSELTLRDAAWIGAAQASIVIRGFTRSGTTISTAMLAGVGRRRAEEFSFALGVVITPPAIALEAWRLLKSHGEIASPVHLGQLLLPGLVGMVASFFAGLLALRWLSRWLEAGRWQYFGYYCLGAAAVVAWLAQRGF
jgi:undecaprenyl-diphosphatase